MLKILMLSVLLQQAAAPVGTGVIEGVLRDGSGQPLAGARVAAMVPPARAVRGRVGAEFASLAQTDSNGRYRLEVSPGSYYISAGKVENPTFYPGTLQIGSGTPVTVARGATVSNINFTLASTRAASECVTTTISPGVARSLSLYVCIAVDGGGKVPIFSDGAVPKLKLTNVKTNTSYEMSFGEVPRFLDRNLVAVPHLISVPLNLEATPDEYRVSVEDLPAGYAVRSVTHRADEPGEKIVDVLNQPLKISARHIDAISAGTYAAAGSPSFPIRITLVRMLLPLPSSGVRVTGAGEGVGSAVYLSDRPGTLFADGTFEFVGVPPGVHSIVKIIGTDAAVARTIVRNRDVDGVTVQIAPVVPADIFTIRPLTPDVTDATVTTLSTLIGRVLDESTQQPIRIATATLTGYRGSIRGFVVAGRDFRITNLLPGRYSLTVEAPDYKSKTEQVTIGLLETTIEIKLAK
jgi:hypothetical protein